MITSDIVGSLTYPTNLYNLSSDQRAKIEAHRQSCLVATRERLAKKSQDQLHHEADSIKAWNDYASRNRKQWGLSHLDTLSDAQLDAKPGKLTYQPKAAPVDAVLIKVGSQDVVVKHGIVGQTRPNHAGGGKRGKITRLTPASVDRMKLHIRNLSDLSIKAFLTLTYPDSYPSNGREVKRHLKNMREWLKRRKVSGVWFLEFQARGAPHYHLFLDRWIPGGVDAVARAWDKIVSSGDEKHIKWHKGELSGRPCLEMMRVPHAASAYATKYATKLEQKIVPSLYQDVGRFWGQFGGLKPAWCYISGFGHYYCKQVRDMVLTFRERFDTDACSINRWSNKAFVSMTMWGGAIDLDALAFRSFVHCWRESVNI